MRAAALAALSVGLAGIGHSVIGRMPLPPAGALAAVLLVAPLMWATTGRRLRFGPLVALLGAGQVIAHVTFTIVHGVIASAGTPAMTRMPTPMTGAATCVAAGHVAAGSHMAHDMGMTAGPPPAAHAMGLLPSGRMLLGHLAATLLLAAVLALGERTLWQVRRLIPRWVTATRFPATGAGPTAGGERSAYVQGVCRCPRLTRGPPALTAS